jgi:hypothetical protein
VEERPLSETHSDWPLAACGVLSEQSQRDEELIGGRLRIRKGRDLGSEVELVKADGVVRTLESQERWLGRSGGRVEWRVLR